MEPSSPEPGLSILEAQTRPEIVRARLVAPGITVELCEFPAVRADDMVTCEVQPVLSLGLSPLMPVAQGRYRPEGARPFMNFGQLHFRPAGVPLQFRIAGGPFRSVRCRFDPERFAAATGIADDWTADQLAACLDIRQPRIEDAMLRLSEECLAPGIASDTLVEGLGAVILVDLARYLQDARRRAEATCGGLSAWRLRRVVDRIEASTVQPSVAELASLCGLGRHHFMRAFKQSAGQTVAKYAEAVRIGRAKTLLVTTDLPMNEIARALGFRTAGRFSAVFRRATGRGPRDWRRHMR